MATARTGSVRIIAGQWRGRKLPVLDAPGLRPTADRLRETVFNWLMPYLPGARCLDAFAGTGALGLEAASRGAAEVILLENQPASARHLHALAARLTSAPACPNDTACRVQVLHTDALHWLAHEPPIPFDIVFLDPPFALELWQPACAHLQQYHWLHESSLIYLEFPATRPLSLPFPILRATRVGQTAAQLIQTACLTSACPLA